MEWVFWIGIAGAFYSYLVYPLLLAAMPWRPTRNSGLESPLPEQVAPPRVTVVITAYNESARIETKIANTLELIPPAGGLEILVASDASSDDTDQKVGRFAPAGVRLVRAPERQGKEYAQQLAIAASSGDILVFTDVATAVQPDAVARIVRTFSDPRIGAVSSEDRLMAPDGQPAGEGAYVRYEMWLRGLESRVGSLVGLSGSLFAARREVCADWDVRIPSDFNVALNCVRRGYRAVTDPDLLGFYPDANDAGKEYRRKLRTVIRGIAAMVRRREMLNPLRYPLFAFQLFSHKLMRWAVPWFLLTALAANMALAGDGLVYGVTLAAQLLIYATVALAALYPPLRDNRLARIPFFFVQVNLAVAHATVAYLSGSRVTVWEPTRR